MTTGEAAAPRASAAAPWASAAPIEAFVRRLERYRRFDPAAMAALRRRAGYALADSPEAMDAFFRIAPADLGEDREIYFLVATLYGLHGGGGEGPPAGGNFGAALARLRSRKGGRRIDRRVTALLNSDFEWVAAGKPRPGELGFRLRGVVKLMKQEAVDVDWEALLGDLLQWAAPDRRVQIRWARAYFGRDSGSDGEGDALGVS